MTDAEYLLDVVEHLRDAVIDVATSSDKYDKTISTRILFHVELVEGLVSELVNNERNIRVVL